MDELASAGVGFGLGGVVVADGAGAGEVAVWVAEVAGGDGGVAEGGVFVGGVGCCVCLGACLALGPAVVGRAECCAGAAGVVGAVGVEAAVLGRFVVPLGGCGGAGFVVVLARLSKVTTYGWGT